MLLNILHTQNRHSPRPNNHPAQSQIAKLLEPLSSGLTPPTKRGLQDDCRMETNIFHINFNVHLKSASFHLWTY